MSWRHFTHRADIGIEGSGASLEEAFAEAAVALCAVVTEPERVRARERVELRCAGEDPELLFVDWLNAVIAAMATRGMLFGRCSVRISAGQLRAQLWGEPVDVERHQPAVEVKGATYTALRVGRDAQGQWRARTVVDV